MVEVGSRLRPPHQQSPDAPRTEGYDGDEATHGWVHSYETGSTVDGPGVRLMLFMSGCFLRCQFCHNPDTWQLKDGTRSNWRMPSGRLGDFAPALRAMGGGLTISGGEPLVQLGFTRGSFAAAKEMGLHTALDTSGFLGHRADDDYLHERRSGAAGHQERRSGHLSEGDGRRTAPTLRFAERLAAMGKPVWVRYVLVPGLTDDPENIGEVARFVAPMTNVEWVECCPSTRWARSNGRRSGSTTSSAKRRPRAAAGPHGARDLPRCRLPRALNLSRENGMLASSATLIGSQPILALFLAIGLGYAVGQINILGFSLGVGAVLFVGLFLGAIAPKAQVAGPIGLVGLIMFLYGIGILYGRQFFEGLSGAGRIYNLLALRRGHRRACWWHLALARIFDVKLGHTLGIFAGSMTSTATLQAALDTISNREPSIGYSVAYPFGVIGPILCFYFLTRRVKPVFPRSPPASTWAR